MNQPNSALDKNGAANQLSRQEAWMSVGIIALLLFALFLNLGLHPLKHEEPRRALVALEMMLRNNLIVPTELGALYYNKPPLYNWVIIGAFHLFGDYSEFTVRFFSVLSFLGIGLLVFLTGRHYANPRFAVYSALFFLVTVDILYYFSITGEIDLFYSLLTFAQILAVYHYHRQKKFFLLFVVVYLLAALGSLTKGLPSIAFAGISLVSWLAYQHDFKRLFSLQHFLGILLYVLIVGGYFYWYSLYENPIGFVNRLYTESSNRTVAANGFTDLMVHLVSFPTITFINLMPGALLAIFIFRKNIWSSLKAQPFVFYCAFIFIANFALYWLSPGAKARYTYMLYPFPLMLMVYSYLSDDGGHYLKRRVILHRIILLLIILVGIAALALPWVEKLKVLVDNLWLPTTITLFGTAIILVIYFKFRQLRVLALILLAVFVRIAFDLTVLPVRSMEGSEAQDKIDAAAIIGITADAPLHVLEGSMISRSTVFYLERTRQKVLDFENQTHQGHYFLAYADALEGNHYDILYTLDYNGEVVHLIKFK